MPDPWSLEPVTPMPASPAPVPPESHPSGSREQRDAEPLVLAAVAVAMGTVLAPRRLRLPGGSAVDVDGVGDDPPVLVEVYAHQGALRGSQPKKLATDALKLLTVRETLAPGARLVLALTDERAAAGIRSGWLGEALALWGVEVVVVGLDAAVTAGLVAAQARQTMVNPPPASPR